MNKIIAISENKEEDSILGIAIGEPFYDLAFMTLTRIGFNPIKQINNTVILKCDVFNSGILNEFSMNSGLDYDFFNFFVCSQEEFETIIISIENE
jgi:hypothetical protein